MDAEARLVLASGSPRRADLLRQVGLRFEVRVPDVPEDVPPGTPPEDAVLRVAERKADAALPHEGWVLAADTVGVTPDGRVLGKPVDGEDAVRTLLALGGRTHRVLTGVCVARSADGARFTRVVATEVDFAPLGEEQARAYVATGEPLGKAGAYGIQGVGAALVRAVRGEYSNVVGLPLRATVELLDEAAYPLPAALRPGRR